MSYHEPVLLQQCIDQLDLKPDGTYVDVTFGGGGHSREIVKHLSERGHLYGFDQDGDAKENTLSDSQFTLIAANFRHLKKQLRFKGVKQIDGLLADLGISSHQIDEPNRGFSIRFDGPLDMRMNQGKIKSAKEVVNNYPEEDLTKVFKEYGELNRARLIAKVIANARNEKPIETTNDLKKALESLAPKFKADKFWAQVFQAIRIEVNEEMDALKELLEQATEILKPGGRLVFMSYHSLEDRPVKNYFKTGNFIGEPEKDFYGNLLRPLTPLTRKPIIANADEIALNPRARSAKLRVAEKNEDE